MRPADAVLVQDLNPARAPCMNVEDSCVDAIPAVSSALFKRFCSLALRSASTSDMLPHFPTATFSSCSNHNVGLFMMLVCFQGIGDACVGCVLLHCALLMKGAVKTLGTQLSLIKQHVYSAAGPRVRGIW